MVNQQSRFLLTGDSFAPVDEQFEVLKSGGRIQRILLPSEAFDDAEDFLALSGVNSYSFFPDLQGLGMKHREKVTKDLRLAKKAYNITTE